MTFTIFALLFTAHLLGDVIFSNHRLSILKRSDVFLLRLAGNASHCAIHALFAGLLLAFIGDLWFKAALLVLGAHFVIDYIRSGTEIRLFGSGKIHVKRSEFNSWVSGKSNDPDKMNMKNLWPWLSINVLDQTAHAASLYGIARIITI